MTTEAPPIAQAGCDRRAGRRLAGLAGTATVIALVVMVVNPAAQPLRSGASTELLGATILQPSSSQTSPSCQVVPASASFTHAYSRAQATYVTQGVTVSNLDPACVGATLTATLEDRTQTPLPRATGSTTVTASTAFVPMGTPSPPASAVYVVHVQLTGGFAVPAECSGMTLQNDITATPGSYTINGTNNADLIYGLAGPYVINGLQGADCISGYDGNTVNDGNANDVVLASVGTKGSNTVTVGNGNDLVKLGNGQDVVTIGTGTDTVYGGTGPTSITASNGIYTFFTGGRTPTLPIPPPASPSTVQIGRGAVTTIYAGNGDLTVISPTNGTVMIYLSTGPGVINGGGAKNICHVPVTNSYTIIPGTCTVVHP